MIKLKEKPKLENIKLRLQEMEKKRAGKQPRGEREELGSG